VNKVAQSIFFEGQERVDLLKRSIELQPSNAKSATWLGDTLLRMGKPEEALSALNQAVASEDPLWSARASDLIADVYRARNGATR